MHKYLRILSKSELAEIYGISTSTLTRWIEEYPALLNEVENFGKYKTQKLFTQKQVEIIFKYLGFPDQFSIDNYIRVAVKSYYKNELAKMYNVSVVTFKKFIKNIEKICYLIENNNKKFDSNEVSAIFQYIGHPIKEKNSYIK